MGHYWFGIISYYMTESMMSSFNSNAAVDQIVVSKHEEVKRNEAVVILGSVENKGSNEVRNISVQVDLFDEGGKFVDQCDEYLRGALKPGESRNFKVSCGGCKDRPVVAHDSYKVRVIGL